MKSDLTEEDFYFDSSGLMVLTEKYHLKKGFCCGNGCRHCPYEFINMPESHRNKLLLLRQNGKTED